MRRKTVMVVDGQGGGLGKAIIERMRKSGMNVHIIGVGTNTAATGAMLKAGADEAATGENAVIYNSQAADYIIGGVGIVAANSMMGEISPAMANAVSSSRCMKLLIPMNKCDLFVAGIQESGIGDKIDDALSKIEIDN